MKNLKKLSIFILCLTIILSCFNVGCGGEDACITLIPTTTYVMETTPANPKTIEIVFRTDRKENNSLGVLLGNNNDKDSFINLEVGTLGCLSFTYVDENNVEYSCRFNKDVRTGEWIHLAITWDYETIKCYVDGKLFKSNKLKVDSEPNLKNPFAIGGDLGSLNASYFKGQIKSVALFSDVRTDKEISSDSSKVNKKADNLIAYYDFSKVDNKATTISDLSKNGIALNVKNDLIDNVSEPTDYEFSFMAIGDTQIVTLEYPDKLKNIYDYVLENVEKKKVKYVLGLGDITDKDTEVEWNVVLPQIKRMDGVVPYSIIRGNHDIYSTSNQMLRESYYDKYLGGEDNFYAKQYIDCYKGYENEKFYARNTVHEFSSSTRDYLVISLDYGPNDDILAWANGVIEAHPNHNVIITTHAYINAQSKYVNEETGGPAPTKHFADANNGDDLWNELVKKHKNIVMVICGHISSSTIVLKQSTGENGNIVSEILIDPQGLDEKIGAMGMVATFYVGNDGKTVTVDYYSTAHKKYYLKESQYTFEIATIERV